jgi:hypothetical protein
MQMSSPEKDQEAELRALLVETGRFIERWGGVPPATRERLARWHEPPALPSGVWQTPAELREALDYCALTVGQPLELIGHALHLVLRYAKSLHTPAVWAEEQGRVQPWLGERAGVLPAPRRPPEAYIETKPLAHVHVGTLSCDLEARWILSAVAPQPGVDRGSASTMDARAWDLHLEVALIFLRREAEAARFSAKRMDVLVFCGGEHSRLPLPRTVKRRLHDRPHERPPEQLGVPLVEKRLYIPAGHGVERSVRAAVEDLVALLCLYLVQENLVRLESDGDVRAWLSDYLRRYKGARELGVDYALGEIVTHYQIPEDYRALRKYVAKTLHGLVVHQRRQEGLDPAQTSIAVRAMDLSAGWDEDADVPSQGRHRRHPVMRVPSTNPGLQTIATAAASVGMSVRGLYRLVNTGKVQTEPVTYGRKQYLMISAEEIHRLQEARAQQQWRKDLIEGLSATAGIAKGSARRWVERQEAQGLDREAIRQRVRKRLQRLQRGEERDA